MKIQYRFWLLLFALLTLSAYAMDYGVRFKSHSAPGRERTAVNFGGGEDFNFKNHIALEFDIAFYDTPHFGQIAYITLNDGREISVVSTLAENGQYNPAVIIDSKVYPIASDFIASPLDPAKIKLKLDKGRNSVILKYNSEGLVVPFDLSNVKRAESIIIGATKKMTAVAPMEIKDVRIFVDGKNTNHWELATHTDSITSDGIANKMALTNNPVWIIDDHIKWKEILSFRSPEVLQTAFNPATTDFYILSEKTLRTFSAKTGKTTEHPIGADNRVMKYSNHLVYDSLLNSLLSYNLRTGATSILNLNTLTWSGAPADDSEAYFHNHAFTTDGRYAYTFGGYGFYLYNNTFYKIDLQTGEISPLRLTPLPEPRTSSSAAVVGNKLYIFGGAGNAVGKQEIPSEHYFDLWEYDLTTLSGKKLWEITDEERTFTFSSSMYMSGSENALYLASTLQGGSMMKICVDHPGMEIVVAGVNSLMDYRDCVFDLFRSSDGLMYYLLIDKRQDDLSHDYAIYEVTYPFSDYPTYQALTSYHNFTASDSKRPYLWILWIGIIVLLAIAGFFAVKVVKRKKMISGDSTDAVSEAGHKPMEAQEPVLSKAEKPNAVIEEVSEAMETQESEPVNESVEGSVNEHNEAANQSVNDTANESIKEKQPDTVETEAAAAETNGEDFAALSSYSGVNHYDRSKSAISLLGDFNVRDKQGNDITASFTSRLKDLLILLVLESQKSSKGVRQQLIDELIWNDKDEKSVKNNRNVYMRKLRVLLMEVGDFEIIFDKGYYLLNNKDVACDYVEVWKCIKEVDKNEEADHELIEKTLELLLHGPLLPHTTYPWLDDFKSNYSDASLNMLFRLLKYVQTKNPNDDQLIYKIAETISCHDPLSEEALEIKCHILAKRKMTGLAKNIYERFCREYQESFGKDFATSFATLFNK